MRILFAAGDFDKQLHATNKIVYQIAESLANNGHECIFAGLSLFDNACCEQQGSLKLVRFNSTHPCDKAFLALENFVKDSGTDREKAKRKFYFAHPFHTAALLYRYNVSKKPLYCVDSYAKQLRSLAEREKPDVLVVSYMPFYQAHALVTRYRWDIPVIAYQLDPWGLHCTLSTEQAKHKNIIEETALFRRCSAIITTPVLKRQYASHPAYQEFLPKITALNFPNVKPAPASNPDDCVFNFDKDIINLLFCGIIHDEYRNPQFMLNSFNALRESGFTNFKLHFLGSNESDSLKAFVQHNNWVVCHDSVPLEKAIATMDKADILINIGNTYNNQVPSKIFDYFAFGKPILNIEKIADCPAREYFDRYPLTFTLREWSDNGTDTTSLKEFLDGAKQARTDYSTVKNLFGDCTLNYATETFCDILNNV